MMTAVINLDCVVDDIALHYSIATLAAFLDVSLTGFNQALSLVKLQSNPHRQMCPIRQLLKKMTPCVTYNQCYYILGYLYI